MTASLKLTETTPPINIGDDIKKLDISDNSQFLDAYLEIDLKAIQHNYLYISKLVACKTTAAAVKADAYGLGMQPVATCLAAIGCHEFCVSNLAEAIELRQYLPDVTIYVLHGLQAGQEEYIAAINAIPVINNLPQLELWGNFAHQQQQQLPVILHFDTGMNRFGLTTEETKYLLNKPELLNGLNLQMVMSHLACAPEPEHPLNELQLHRFNKIVKYFPGITASFINSPGAFLPSKYHFDHARIGRGLYGPNFTTALTDKELQSTIKLTAKILQIRKLTTTSTIGYGATKEVSPGTVIATIALGYADGFMRVNTERGMVYINGHYAPIIGVISMDLTVIDVTNIPEDKLALGQEVEIIGPNITLGKLATHSGAYSYEMLTRLGKRFVRKYIGG